VHYKSLQELPEGHFARAAPPFNPQAHRDRVGFEIFTSELSYNNFMRILIEVYKGPLLSAQKAGHVQVKEDDAVKVFGPIESVLAVSDIILAALEERIVNWDSETQLIGDVFVKYGDLLKVYATYAREQQAAKIAQSHCTTSKTYHAMLKISQQFPACQSRDLSSLLIMPIQRIPRYELLLRDFIKATPTTHPDMPLLNQALTKIKSVAEQVDRSVEEYKQLEKLLAIQASFSGGSSVDLVKPGRRFIREGSLIKVCRRANKTRKFWLFSDILLYGIPILTGSNVVSGEFSLLHLQLQDLPDALQPHDEPQLSDSPNMSNPSSNRLSMAPSASKPIWQFMIQSRQKSFVVFANSLQEKADWMVDIMTAVKEFQDAAKSLQTSNKSKGGVPGTIDVAPAWVPDSMAPQCKICSNEFGLVTRRHHCRHCGLVVCDDCSKGRIVIQGLDKHPVRVCNNCVNKLGYGSYDASRGQPTGHASVRYQPSTPINLLANLAPPPGASPTSTSPLPHADLQEYS
jgi:FYVE/RhoGEF/PH domain-containing protein 5/6